MSGSYRWTKPVHVPKVTPRGQALILAGGKATRVREDGIEVSPLGKAFEQLFGKDLLWYTLLGARAAGLSRVVVAGDSDANRERIELVRRDLALNGVRFAWFDNFGDEGRGVQGMARQVMRAGKLDRDYLGLFGHDPVPPSDLRDLMAARKTLSAKRKKAQVMYTHEPVLLGGANISLPSEPPKATWPMIGDAEFALSAPDFDYDEFRLLRSAFEQDRLGAIASSWPKEFDTGIEYLRFMAEMGPHLAALTYPMPVLDSTAEVRWKRPNLLGPAVAVENSLRL